jgi:CubicO group peptidase (beta-lactamase class C family)
MDEFNVPGMAVAIVKDGQVLAIETFGMRAPGEAGAGEGAAPTPDTIYYIASITKTYLATAVCALADDGKLTLDDPVKKHLPRFALASGPGESAEKITIRDLLSHRAGIDKRDPIVTLDAFTGEINDDRYYRWLATFKPKWETGYSNIHYTLLGRVVEAASGKPWREYLDERVFKPAGLARTTGYASRMYADPDCAIPMERVDGRWRACRLIKTDRTMHAAGGLGASARDAARWLILHMNDGEIEGTRVISAERAKEMRTLQSRFQKKEGVIRIMEGFGLGWQVGTFHGTPICSHGGGYAGTATYYALLPEKKYGFALLMNAGAEASGLQDVIAVDILDRLIEDDEPIDVLEGYRKRVAEQKWSNASRHAQRQAEQSKPLELTRPVNEYAGKFRSADLGTMTIAPDGARLKVLMGECELDVGPAGPDAFKVLGPTAEGVDFAFVVSPAGEVTALGLDVPEEGTLLFERTISSLTIDKESFPYYPGVLVSLDKAQVLALPKSPEDLKTTDADLWIEPRDPEITALTADIVRALGISHVGRDARVALATDPYEAIVHVPAHCTWVDRLPVEGISSGSVFLVQSTGNKYYKVRIDAWEKDGVAGGSMRLSFAPIVKP